jgi:hypothetical protein
MLSHAPYGENHTKQTHSVGRMRNFNILKQVVHIANTGFQRIPLPLENYNFFGLYRRLFVQQAALKGGEHLRPFLIGENLLM